MKSTQPNVPQAMNFRFSPGRGPATAASSMVATSQGVGTLAGIDMLRRGGNAIDAAVAAAAALCVAEPMSTGLGGDCFAMVWDGEQVHGLDGGGPAPVTARTYPVECTGPSSVVVPAALASWASLNQRFGRLGLDSCLQPAIHLAERGLAAGFHCSREWRRSEHAPAEFGQAPSAGEIFRLPDLAQTLRAIATDGLPHFYLGPVADAIVSSTWLEHADLATFQPRWVEPLSISYHGVQVFEMPPPTQGIAALEGLGLLAGMDSPSLTNQVRAVALALEDALVRVRDGAEVADLLEEKALTKRRGSAARLSPEPGGGTAYLCAVDSDGMAISLIQSLYDDFGSGVVAPGTGVVLNNRASCFEIAGRVEPGRRPYHTTIPGMMVENGKLRGPFGVMGGLIQAQAHVQLVSALVDQELDPQAALDQPRFRIDRDSVQLEEGYWAAANELAEEGIGVALNSDRPHFGGGQAIQIIENRMLGGSDPRKDGFAAGF